MQPQAARRKDAHQLPWTGAGRNGSLGADDGGRQALAPSVIPFGDLNAPRQADHTDIDEMVQAFARDGSAGAFVVAACLFAVAAGGHRAPAGAVGAAAIEQEQLALVIGAGA